MTEWLKQDLPDEIHPYANVKRKKYNSYKGEITPAVPNVIERNFHAEQPNIKWLTDITEFHIINRQEKSIFLRLLTVLTGSRHAVPH